jgi:hypothetical protein
MIMQVHSTSGDQEKLVRLDESNHILKNLDTDLNNEDMPSDEEDVEENPELLAELEQRQEDYIEEFMGRTFDLKQEYTEEIKAECKKDGLSRDETKAKMAAAEKRIKEVRRQGTKQLKKYFAEITEDDELALPDKIAYFREEGAKISSQMDELLRLN